jgi:hypothetical protein
MRQEAHVSLGVKGRIGNLTGILILRVYSQYGIKILALGLGNQSKSAGGDTSFGKYCNMESDIAGTNVHLDHDMARVGPTVGQMLFPFSPVSLACLDRKLQPRLGEPSN